MGIRGEARREYLEECRKRREEMKSARLLGESVREIASRYGVSISRIYQLLNMSGVTASQARRTRTQEEVDRVLCHYSPGCNISALARKLGVKPHRLLYLIRISPKLRRQCRFPH